MLSNRLARITTYVSKETEFLYDLCCDHGKLGEFFLSENKKVIFVDQVPEITNSLKQRLFGKENLEILTRDILGITEIKDNSTIVIAGIGSILASNFLRSIKKQINETHEFIICPQGNIHIFLETLVELKLTRVSECIIQDEGRFYEIYKCKALNTYKNQEYPNRDFSNTSTRTYALKQLKFLESDTLQCNNMANLLARELKIILNS